MLFAGREVRIGKNCAKDLEYGPRPQAEGRTQTEGTVFPNTDRPRPANNMFIFFFFAVKKKKWKRRESWKIIGAVRMRKSGPLERAQLANQIQGFRIPDRSDA